MELACHCITDFPGKLKGVLHSQEDGTDIFPSKLHDMSELYVSSQISIISANFQRLSKVLKKNLAASRDNAPLIKRFLKSLPADVFHLASNT